MLEGVQEMQIAEYCKRAPWDRSIATCGMENFIPNISYFN